MFIQKARVRPSEEQFQTMIDGVVLTPQEEAVLRKTLDLAFDSGNVPEDMKQDRACFTSAMTKIPRERSRPYL